MDIVRAHVETVEVVGLDEAYLDLEGLHSPRAAMRRLVTEINRAMQLTCSVGIGPNKLVAKVASDAEKPAGFVVLTRHEACERFAAAPPSIVPGIGPKTAARLSELGLTTLGAVAAAPEQLLGARFGANHGRDLRRRGRFEHDAPVGASHKRVSESRERTFDRDISDGQKLEEIMARLAPGRCESLRSPGRTGRTIGIKVRLDDFTTITRARSLAQPTCDAQLVAGTALELLRRYAPARPVRLLGVRVAGLAPDAAQGGDRRAPGRDAGQARDRPGPPPDPPA